MFDSLSGSVVPFENEKVLSDVADVVRRPVSRTVAPFVVMP